jgi:hypothetical protein
LLYLHIKRPSSKYDKAQFNLTVQYGSETRKLRAEDKGRTEISEMRFVRSVLGVSLRDKMRSEDVRKQLNTEQMVEEIQE